MSEKALHEPSPKVTKLRAPIVATVSMDAPWRWLAAGWNDFLKAPALSLGYGVFTIGGGVLIISALWQNGLSALIPVAFGVFALLGPIVAVGLYEVSRRLEASEPLDLKSIVLVKTKSPTQIAYMGFLLMFAVLVWVRIAIIIYAIFVSGTYLPLNDFMTFAIGTPAGLSMLVVGTIVGGFIAFSIYAISVISLPMLMNEETDIFTAMAKSIMAIKENTAPMLLWAWLIAMMTAAGIATFFVGLAVAFPVIGYASWRAYRDLSLSTQ